MFSGDGSTSAGQTISTQASYSPTTGSSQSSSLSSFPSSSSILSASSSISSLPSFSSSSSTYHSVFPLPDLRPLKLTTCSALDPAKTICRFEVPGGGVCRDAGCKDLHLQRVGRESGEDVVEPSDDDTAEYLYGVLPAAWLTKHGVTVPGIAGALQQARDPSSGGVFEERVAQVLAGLGPPPPG
ncbi:hypothetical protein B0H17DRAFT_1054978 [Mycena rosella]|uniref:Zinc-finger domain-containing protein n=1 Tax=Mycena rosella TaxID=1033263 RepID=A0AAD7DQZ8_MYCRO|nr:hypothetical protein B0H17DRAFT_1054978 [Mycena rosella]